MNKLSQKSAESILSKRVMVSTPSVKEVQVTSISNSEFAWENPVAGGSPTYRIVNTNALTPYLMEQAQELYNEGKFDEACSKQLSFNASPELAEELKAIGFANAEFDTIVNKDAVEILVIRKLRPIAVKRAEKAVFKFASPKGATETIGSPVVNKVEAEAVI